MPYKPGTVDPRIKRPGLVNDNRCDVPDGWRRCIRCREVKQLDVATFSKRDDGKYFTSWCQECYRRRAKEYAAGRRATKPETVREEKRRHNKSERGRAAKRLRSFIDNNARRQRHLGKPFRWDADGWKRCMGAWRYRCAYCDAGGFLTQDHFIPINHPNFPGTVPGNIVPACESCNYSKRDRHPGEFVTNPDRLERIMRFLQKEAALAKTEGVL